MKCLFYLLPIMLLTACKSGPDEQSNTERLDVLARRYVKLGLTAGLYDGDFVDAYYGPDSLKPTGVKSSVFPKDSLLAQSTDIQEALRQLAKEIQNDTLKTRAAWLLKQLTACDRRIRIFSGETGTFDEESRDLFDAVAPVYSEAHFKSLIARLETVVPGNGPLADRFQKLAKNFQIPASKIDTVFRTAIAEARKRTLMHYPLPDGETFTLEYVTDKPWSGYNWYQGNYKSKIQINISQPIFIVRAVDLACHEGYPGHHVYNALLEKNLYRDKGWVEISLYPLFSPQSLIAEGSANYGIDLAFPGTEQKEFCKKVLMPLAGMDVTLADPYFEALALSSQLNYARNEVARGILSGKMSEPEGQRWLSDYCLLTEKGAADYIRFIRKYRSYVINYNYGQELVRKFVEQPGDSSAQRWQRFGQLLSHTYTASGLMAAGH